MSNNNPMNIPPSIHSAQQYLTSTNGWLNFDPSTPKLYICAETSDFDPHILQAWRDEGFLIEYISMSKGRAAFKQKLESIGAGKGLGDRYCMVAYGDAAAVCLEHHLTPHAWNSKLAALVAYYPPNIPAPVTRFPNSYRVCVHLAGGSSENGTDTIGVNKTAEVLGIQGKRRTVQKRITLGSGPGGLQTAFKYKCYVYKGVEAGFAERDMDEFDGVAENVSWSRSLYCMRQALGAQIEMERGWDEQNEVIWHGSGDPVVDAEKVLDKFGQIREPYVVCGPTVTGGLGKKDLYRFYGEVFLPEGMEQKRDTNMNVRLLSRTVGTDRLVDELYLSFTHAADMDWILPGIPPTNSKIEIIVVCIVGIKGGKIWCEHMYWDQASVLMQVGLLDPKKSISEKWDKKGVKRIPVFGKEGARAIVDLVDRKDGVEDGPEELNRLIEDWDIGDK